jgi:hypothetical protein
MVHELEDGLEAWAHFELVQDSKATGVSALDAEVVHLLAGPAHCEYEFGGVLWAPADEVHSEACTVRLGG